MSFNTTNKAAPIKENKTDTPSIEKKSVSSEFIAFGYLVSGKKFTDRRTK